MEKTSKNFIENGFPAFGAGGINGFLDQYERNVDAVILSANGARCGKCFFAQGKWTSLANTMVIIPDKNIANARFLWYVLNNEERWVKYGTGQPFIRPSMVRTHIVALPEISVQEKIVKILDKAELIKESAINFTIIKQQLALSTFYEMFGDPIENPLDWKKITISETDSLVQIGPFGSLLHKSDYIPGGVPIVNPKHIINGKIKTSESETISEIKAEGLTKYNLESGDIVIGRRGEMGRCAIVSSESHGYLCGTGSLFIRPNLELLNPVFLRHLISSKSMKKHLESIAWGATMPNLNTEKIKSLKIPIPPINIQNKFASTLELIQKILTTEDLSSILSNSIKQELLT